MTDRQRLCHHQASQSLALIPFRRCHHVSILTCLRIIEGRPIGMGRIEGPFQKALSQPQRLARRSSFASPNLPCWIGGFLPQSADLMALLAQKADLPQSLDGLPANGGNSSSPSASCFPVPPVRRRGLPRVLPLQLPYRVF